MPSQIFTFGQNPSLRFLVTKPKTLRQGWTRRFLSSKIMQDYSTLLICLVPLFLLSLPPSLSFLHFLVSFLSFGSLSHCHHEQGSVMSVSSVCMCVCAQQCPQPTEGNDKEGAFIAYKLGSCSLYFPHYLDGKCDPWLLWELLSPLPRFWPHDRHYLALPWRPGHPSHDPLPDLEEPRLLSWFQGTRTRIFSPTNLWYLMVKNPKSCDDIMWNYI